MISVYDATALQTYFKTIRKPWWKPFLAGGDHLDASYEMHVHGVPVSIGGLNKTWRSVTKAARVYYALHRWLNPGPPALGLSHVDSLLKKAGLNHMTVPEGVRLIREDGHELEQKHVEFARWIENRLALLEFRTQGGLPRVAEDLLNSQTDLNRALIQTVAIAKHDPEEGATLADELLISSLQGAAQAVESILSPDPGNRLRASLMLPFTTRVAVDAFAEAAGGVATQRADAAAELWTRLPSEASAFLVLVGETERNQHLGFWIPVVEGDGGNHLPGAPTAFATLAGSAVMKQDLPPLRGFSQALDDLWRGYVRSRVAGRFFVSLPFIVKKNNGSDALAVINVNADPGARPDWYRAYHPEWLNAARLSATPFVAAAVYASLLRFSSRKVPLSLDRRLRDWNIFLSSGPLALPEPEDEED